MQPKLLTVLREGYSPALLRADLFAGITVAMVALPLSIAIAIASGADPGKGLITGKCADLGQQTVPQLRALAARAPYFHDGSAQDLGAVVDFYNQRFNINFTVQEKTDLVNFLSAL